MYELVQVAQNSYYIQSPAKIGLVRLNDADACLIDSGGDKEAGRKVLRVLNENGWRLTAIYNTHSNADHIGGNRYLQAQTGCRVYAPDIERAFTRHTVLEPAFLYGGFPPEELRHKFLMAHESDAAPLTADSLPEGFRLVELPGHFFNMAGFISADGVFYMADCLSSKRTLDKYQICFLYDVAAYLNTLEAVKTIPAKVFVPAHADVTDDIAPLAQLNIDKVNEIADSITDLCAEPLCFERLLQKLFEKYSLNMSFEQYALVGSTVRSYLSYLKERGRINAFFDNNMLLWAGS